MVKDIIGYIVKLGSAGAKKKLIEKGVKKKDADKIIRKINVNQAENISLFKKTARSPKADPNIQTAADNVAKEALNKKEAYRTGNVKTLPKTDQQLSVQGSGRPSDNLTNQQNLYKKRKTQADIEAKESKLSQQNAHNRRFEDEDDIFGGKVKLNPEAQAFKNKEIKLARDRQVLGRKMRMGAGATAVGAGVAGSAKETKQETSTKATPATPANKGKFNKPTLRDALGVKKTDTKAIAKAYDKRKENKAKREALEQNKPGFFSQPQDGATMLQKQTQSDAYPASENVKSFKKNAGIGAEMALAASAPLAFLTKKMAKSTAKKAVKDVKAPVKADKVKPKPTKNTLMTKLNSKKKNTPEQTAQTEDDLRSFISGTKNIDTSKANWLLSEKARNNKPFTADEERVLKNVDAFTKDTSKQSRAKEVVRVARADNMALAKLKEGDVLTNKSHTFAYGQKDTDEKFPDYPDPTEKLENVKYKIKTTHDNAEVGHVNDGKRGQSLLARNGKYKVTKTEDVPYKEVEYKDYFGGDSSIKTKRIKAHKVVHLEQLPKDIVAKMTPEEKKKVISGVLSVAGISAIVANREKEEKN